MTALWIRHVGDRPGVLLACQWKITLVPAGRRAAPRDVPAPTTRRNQGILEAPDADR